MVLQYGEHSRVNRLEILEFIKNHDNRLLLHIANDKGDQILEAPEGSSFYERYPFCKDIPEFLKQYMRFFLETKR